jgi:hypothetical protein
MWKSHRVITTREVIVTRFSDSKDWDSPAVSMESTFEISCPMARDQHFQYWSWIGAVLRVWLGALFATPHEISCESPSLIQGSSTK